jgi:cation transport ATPase
MRVPIRTDGGESCDQFLLQKAVQLVLAHRDARPQGEVRLFHHKFVVGAILSALVMVGSMPELVPWWPAILTNHLTLWALTTPVQFWVGWQFLRWFGAARLISPSTDGLYISPESA